VTVLPARFMWCTGCKEFMRRDVEAGVGDLQAVWFRKRHSKCIRSHWWLRKTSSKVEGSSQICYANRAPYRLDFKEVRIDTISLLAGVAKEAG
jgi:hypothetical protein